MNNKEFQREIIMKLKKLREDNNYSQLRISRLLGASAGMVGNIESPKYAQKYTLQQISEICEELNYSIGKIFLGDDITDEENEIANRLIKQIINYLNNI